jgi:hypothetical protein
MLTSLELAKELANGGSKSVSGHSAPRNNANRTGSALAPSEGMSPSPVNDVADPDVEFPMKGRIMSSKLEGGGKSTKVRPAPKAKLSSVEDDAKKMRQSMRQLLLEVFTITMIGTFEVVATVGYTIFSPISPYQVYLWASLIHLGELFGWTFLSCYLFAPPKDCSTEEMRSKQRSDNASIFGRRASQRVGTIASGTFQTDGKKSKLRKVTLQKG